MMTRKCGHNPCTGGTNIGADYSEEEREFLIALDRYKRQHQRPFPTACEVLAVLRGLGYRKTPQPPASIETCTAPSCSP
jgi:hypothetical protein